MVTWNSRHFAQFSVCNEVNQTGILYPIIFNVYADALISEVMNRILGCDCNSHFVSCFSYSDNITLFSPSCDDLNIY